MSLVSYLEYRHRASEKSDSSSSKLVDPLYLNNPDLFECDATVTAIGKDVFGKDTYFWVRLDQTIFHPHGGGQLSDQGTINGKKVDFVHKNKLSKTDLNQIEIEHCFIEDPEFKKGETVKLKVDPENRYLNSVWHTAAHVVDYAVITSFPNLVGHSGQCYPNQSFMKFTSKDGLFPKPEDVKITVDKSIEQIKKLPSHFLVEDGIRKLAIGDHHIPCGGTHVHSLDELKSLVVRKVTHEKKEKMLKVSFAVESEKKTQASS